MENDAILTYDEFIKDKPLVAPDAAGNYPTPHPDYTGYLAEHYMRNGHGQLPPTPTGKDNEQLASVLAFVNEGRWVWQCPLCYAGGIVDPGSLAICIECGSGGSWLRVEMPGDRDAIDAELLRQPGHRHHAPVRDWIPGWNMDMLRERTGRANEIVKETGYTPRALSIGSVRIWIAGESLGASNMNTYISEVLKDLIGRNGEIALEAPLSLASAGAGGYLRLPAGTTAQQPQSPKHYSLRYNTDSDKDAPELFTGGNAWQQLLTTEAVSYETLNRNNDVGTGSTQLARGSHGHTVQFGSGTTLTTYHHNGTGYDIYRILQDSTYANDMGLSYINAASASVTVQGTPIVVGYGLTVYLLNTSPDEQTLGIDWRIMRSQIGQNTIQIVASGHSFTLPGSGDDDAIVQRGYAVIDASVPASGTVTYTLQVKRSNGNKRVSLYNSYVTTAALNLS